MRKVLLFRRCRVAEDTGMDIYPIDKFSKAHYLYSKVEYKKEAVRMLKRGIPGLISNGGKSGYEIMTVFRDSLNHFWAAQTSQI